MKIMRAIGFGLVIIILQLLVPKIFHSFEDTVVGTFNIAQVIMSVSGKTFESRTTPLLPSTNL